MGKRGEGRAYEKEKGKKMVSFGKPSHTIMISLKIKKSTLRPLVTLRPLN